MAKPKFYFERHKMYAYLVKFKGKTFATDQLKQYPNLVNTLTGGYKGNEAEYIRLSLAKNIHEDSALMSCSWGQFQIMGENWQDLGYKSVQDFVQQMQDSESLQLEAFIRFIETKKGFCRKQLTKRRLGYGISSIQRPSLQKTWL